MRGGNEKLDRFSFSPLLTLLSFFLSLFHSFGGVRENCWLLHRAPFSVEQANPSKALQWGSGLKSRERAVSFCLKRFFFLYLVFFSFGDVSSVRPLSSSLGIRSTIEKHGALIGARRGRDGVMATTLVTRPVPPPPRPYALLHEKRRTQLCVRVVRLSVFFPVCVWGERGSVLCFFFFFFARRCLYSG